MPKKRYLLVAASLLFFIFILFSYFVAKERFTQFDFDTTVRIQDHIPHKFDYIFSLFSVIGTVEITMTIWVGFCIWAALKRYWQTLLSLFLLPFGLFIELFGKSFVNHPGPPLLLYRGVIKFDLPSTYIQTGYSYPSGHLTRTAFLATFLAVYFLYHKPLKHQIIYQSVLWVFVVIMAVSRVYLGEHWTSDVIGGFMVGTSFGILAGLTVPHKKSAASSLLNVSK